MYVYVCMLCVYECMYVCVCCVYICMYVCMLCMLCVCMCICMYVCMYVYACQYSSIYLLLVGFSFRTVLQFATVICLGYRKHFENSSSRFVLRITQTKIILK